MKVSVGDISRSIQEVLKRNLGGETWVFGELAGYDRSSARGAHVYATLNEKDDSGAVIAQLSIAIFRQSHTRVLKTLAGSGNPFKLEDGRDVCFKLRLDYYAPYGRLSGIVSDIDPVHTMEEAKKRRLEILMNLEKDGIKDKNRQLPVPAVATRIGLITARGSAAEADFLGELTASGYAFKVYTSHATMQGPQTEPSVLKALERLYRTDAEIICITRGGGDVTDLQWFDNEKIARMILERGVPVFSGIGHEIDRCVLDEIAREHYKTPTALAQTFVSRVDSFLHVLRQGGRTMREATGRTVDRIGYEMQAARQGLRTNTGGHLAYSRQELKNASASLKSGWSDASRQYLLRIHGKLSLLRETFRRTAAAFGYRMKSGIEKLRITPFIIRTARTQLITDGTGIRQGVRKIIRQQDLAPPARQLTLGWKLGAGTLRQSLEKKEAVLDAADPVRVLKRGYTITTRQNGKTLKEGGFAPDEVLVTRSADKTIKSKYMEDTDERR